MCETCGCNEPTVAETHGEGSHAHKHHHHSHEHTVQLDIPVLQKNNRIAQENRAFLAERGIYAVNIISSPGSGKTTLLEALASHFGSKMAVIEGDVQTRRDSERIIRAGSRAVQIETGGACHLDAHSVAHALEDLDSEECKILVIENVGNLVCPSSYDLGENEKWAILSLPEGDDKILKYPSLFSRIQALIISKIDLADRLEFNIRTAVNECKSLNRNFETYSLSAKSGEGVDTLIGYISAKAGI